MIAAGMSPFARGKSSGAIAEGRLESSHAFDTETEPRDNPP